MLSTHTKWPYICEATDVLSCCQGYTRPGSPGDEQEAGFLFSLSPLSFIFGELDLLWLSSLTSFERSSRDTEEYLAINPKHKHTYTQSLFEITTLGPGSGTHISAVKFNVCVLIHCSLYRISLQGCFSVPTQCKLAVGHDVIPLLLRQNCWGRQHGSHIEFSHWSSNFSSPWLY